MTSHDRSLRSAAPPNGFPSEKATSSATAYDITWRDRTSFVGHVSLRWQAPRQKKCIRWCLPTDAACGSMYLGMSLSARTRLQPVTIQECRSGQTRCASSVARHIALEVEFLRVSHGHGTQRASLHQRCINRPGAVRHRPLARWRCGCVSLRVTEYAPYNMPLREQEHIQEL